MFQGRGQGAEGGEGVEVYLSLIPLVVQSAWCKMGKRIYQTPFLSGKTGREVREVRGRMMRKTQVRGGTL